MKVVNVDFVENEMVKLDVVQIGQIEVDSGDESEFGVDGCGDECRDGHAEGTSPAAFPHPNPLHPLHPIPNQSKPIVPLLSFSFIITSSYIFITISYIIVVSISSNSLSFSPITSSYITISFSHSIIIIISLTFVMTISHTIVIKTSSNSITKSNKTSSHNDQ